MPVLHLIAGPNGAGKSTLHECLIAPREPGMPFITAHSQTLKELTAVLEPAQRAEAARAWLEGERQRCLRAGTSFATETTLSHPSRLAMITQARSLGYEVVLYALGLDEPRHLLHRVSQRARDGGQSVPTHKVLDRYSRSIDNMRRAVRMVDLALLLDAADVQEGGPRLIASVVAGHLQLHTLLRPRWVDRVLGFAKV